MSNPSNSDSQTGLRLTRRKARQGFYLLSTLLWVVVVRLGLTLLSYTLLRRLLPRFVRPKVQPDVPVLEGVRTVVWAVQKASRLVPGATCLTQAITAQFLLARQGQPSRVHIGVAKSESGPFQAHAWVKWRGEIIIGGETSRYVPITEFDLLPPSTSDAP